MLTFLGIGAQKAGTTWLYTMLSQHPDIAFPGHKEMHFWDKQFPHAPVSNYFNFFNSPTLYEGEITPSYALLPLDAIKTLYQGAPKLKLIYLIRNPIERAWSAALMALQRAQMEIAEASDQWFLDHFYSKASLLRGDYEYCLRHWYSIYPAENLLLLEYEQLKISPNTLLNQCFEHIGVASFNQTQYALLNSNSRVFEGSGDPIRPRLKTELLKIYHPKIRSLEKYLHKDLSHWLAKDS